MTVTWPAWSTDTRQPCPDCRQTGGHDFDCSFWKSAEPAQSDPRDDPYSRGLAEDDYLNDMIGEPRRTR